MDHAVAGGRRTEDGGRKMAGQAVLAFLFLAAFVGVISCAGPDPLKPQKDVTTVADSAVVAEKEKDPKPPLALPVNQPVQMSFESDPVLYAAVSGNGKTVAYVLENEGRSSLWLIPGDFATNASPQNRLEDMGRISAPALSRDGGHLAFVATDHDAKGDLYLLSADASNATPRRLTGRESADGAPALSPDGGRIYFERLFAGKVLPQLAAIDLGAVTDNRELPKVETLREGAFPAVSPNGESLAFVSFTKDPGGDIWVLDLKSGEAKPITKGPSRDLYPTWSVNGKWIYFSRFDSDTNGDGIINFIDNAVICRVAREDTGLRVYPLTSGSFSAYQPMITPSQILFLSNINGTGNIWSLPLEGEIPLKENVQAQMAVARLLASRLPQTDSLAVLAYYKVLENFGKDEKSSAEAAYEIGKLYQRMGRHGLAIQAFERVMRDFKDSHPDKDLAAIRLAALQGENAWETAATDLKRKEILNNTIIRIKKISEVENASSRIRARAWMTRARLLGDLGQDAASLEKAISFPDRVGTTKDLPPELQAEALFLKARLSSRMGRASAVAPIYLSIITGYPGTPWADRSVEQIIDIHMSDFSHETDGKRMQTLARLAETHREGAPGLSMGALNRMGDITFQNGDRPQAKRWYREVLTRYAETEGASSKDKPPPSRPPTQVAAARLALAEILYREELFRQALDLYEKEMAYRPYEDRLYGLARAAYVQKSLAAANFLFNLGEISAAQKIYNDLIREDSTLVQAHRGYIKCAALLKRINSVLDRYGTQLKKDPDNPVLLYATGLCLTYLEGKKNLDEARRLIESAIRKQGQNPYFHQTLGYIFEVSETVYGEPGGLEKALLSYRKAFFLNNRNQDPQNSANLALNLGNIHFLL
ncbi:MAG: hypothetical protein GY846_21740, partial [Deltaproteobacteria bacterium]|nr:hypothetical protein [Deltaproteobacteria bacterium]